MSPWQPFAASPATTKAISSRRQPSPVRPGRRRDRAPARSAQAAAHIAQLQVEAGAGNQRAQKEVDERRAALHAETLDAIQAVLDDHHYTPETPETIASLLRAIGLPVRAVPARQHYAVVVVVEGEYQEDPEGVWDPLADLVGADDAVIYVGPALPAGYGEDPSYSTRQVSLDTGDARGTLTLRSD